MAPMSFHRPRSQTELLPFRRGLVMRALGCFAMLLVLPLAALASDVAPESPRPARSLTYQNERIDSAPWSTHVVKMAFDDPSLELRSTLARGTILGLSRLSEQALAIPASVGTPLAGVNGDFYERDFSRYAGDPRGLQIVDGELVSSPARAAGYCAFWIDAEGRPRAADVTSKFVASLPDGQKLDFSLNEDRRSSDAVLYTPTLGRSTKTSGGVEVILERNGPEPWLPLRIGENYTAKVREVRQTGDTTLARETLVLSFGPRLATNLATLTPGALVALSTATTPELRGARTAIGGGAIITQGGRAAKIEKPRSSAGLNSYTISSMFERHPRAAVGWNKTHLFLVEVDGRQRGLSVGMTLAELGAYMAKLGCEEAINLDGGGSATFWYRGRVVNSPCDGTERPIANGLVVIRKAGMKSNTARP